MPDAEPHSREQVSLWARPRVWATLAIGAVVVSAAVATFVATRGGSSDSSLAARQAEVEDRGATVMPFDQDQTMHVFRKTADGGVQSVTANEPTDTTQVGLVRDHLRREAKKFAAGDFDDPGKIHGMDMPGLTELRNGVSRIQVRYAELPDGGQITYTTRDTKLVAALHDWFDAQLMDHGAHAHG